MNWLCGMTFAMRADDGAGKEPMPTEEATPGAVPFDGVVRPWWQKQRSRGTPWKTALEDAYAASQSH
jgi:hypothetical protein